MPPQARARARSSVENLFDLVENLQEDQLQDFLHELNSTPNDPNIDVSTGISYFEQQRRRTAAAAAAHKLRPTPSFLNAPPEPVDWPRQKPRPVSGSQWRQSMRIVSAPYAAARNNSNNTSTAGAASPPISPPWTASPPASPPMRRSVTAPMMAPGAAAEKIDTAVVCVQGVPSPVSPPRHLLELSSDDGEEGEDEDEAAHVRPSMREFGAFSLSRDGSAEERVAVHSFAAYTSDEEQGSSSSGSRPVSPSIHAAAEATIPPLPPQQQQQQLPMFNRISTMPLLSAAPPALRPRTATGHAAASANANPRAFRRISRPQFLAPVAAPDEVARTLMQAFLFGERVPAAGRPRLARGEQAEEDEKELAGLLEELVKGEPASPRTRHVFGRVEREAPPVNGIFEVLTEG